MKEGRRVRKSKVAAAPARAAALLVSLGCLLLGMLVAVEPPLIPFQGQLVLRACAQETPGDTDGHGHGSGRNGSNSLQDDFFFPPSLNRLYSPENARAFPIPFNEPTRLSAIATTGYSLVWHRTTVITVEGDVLAVATYGASAQSAAIAQENIILSDIVWIFSDVLNQWAPCALPDDSPVPKNRVLHIAAAIGESVYIYGGAYMEGFDTFEVLSDLWRLSVSRHLGARNHFSCQWEQLPLRDSNGATGEGADVPSALFSASVTPGPPTIVDGQPTYHSFFVFGGCPTGYRSRPTLGRTAFFITRCIDFTHVLWRFNGPSESWTRIEAQQLPTLSASNFFSLGSPQVYFIYGGFQVNTPFQSALTRCFLPDTGEGNQGECQPMQSSPFQLITRGDEITTRFDLQYNRAIIFGSSTSVGDRLEVFQIVYDREADAVTYGTVSPFSFLTTPSFSSASSLFGVRGGFTVSPITDVAAQQVRALVVGNFFHPANGRDLGTWMLLIHHLGDQDPSVVVSASWQSRFYYTSLSARAWPASGIIGNHIFVTTGYAGSFAFSSWALDTDSLRTRVRSDGTREAWERIYINLLNPIIRHQAAYTTLDENTLFVFGGSLGDKKTLNTGFTFNWDTRVVTNYTFADIPARRGCSAVHHDGIVYVYGGLLSDDSVTNEMWRYTVATGAWEQALTHPNQHPRAFHTCNFLFSALGEPEMVCFGGRNFNDTSINAGIVSVYSLVTNIWTDHRDFRRTPMERFSHCAATVNNDDDDLLPTSMVIVGGHNHFNSTNDVWLYDNINSEFIRVENDGGPARLSQARYGHTCQYKNGKMFVIAGTTQHEFFSEVVAFRLTCNAGFQLVENCVPCPVGSYRGNLAAAECMMCPSDLTTETTGATAISDCNICTESGCRHGIGEVVGSDCRCQCHFGYTGEECETNALAIIISTIFGGLFLSYVCFLIIRHYKKAAVSIRHESELKQRLLDEKDQTIELYEQIWTIDPSELKSIKVLDEGAFGRVELMEWETTGLRVAVKILKQAILELDETSKDDFEQEVKFIRQLRHPNVVRFHGAHLGTNPFIVMEFVERGSLQRFLHDSSAEMTATFQHTCLLDTAKGMQYLHQQARIHRDLKSANLLITAAYHIKVTDFTTAKSLIQDQPTVQQQQQQQLEEASRRQRRSRRVGSRTARKYTQVLFKRRGGPKKAQNASVSFADEAEVSHVPVENEGSEDDGSAVVNESSKSSSADSHREDTATLGPAEEAEDAGNSGSDGDDDEVDAEDEGTRLQLWHMTRSVGTLPWCAPEVLRGDEYGLSADVFSYGIVISEVLTRQLPYAGVKGRIQAKILEEGLRPELPLVGEEGKGNNLALQAYVGLAEKCWVENKHARPTFNAIVDFLNGVRVRQPQSQPLRAKSSFRSKSNSLSVSRLSRNRNGSLNRHSFGTQDTSSSIL